MDMFKRVLAFLLALVMLVGELPTVALAEMMDETIPVTEETVAETSEAPTEALETETTVAAETEETVEPSEPTEETRIPETTEVTVATEPVATEATVPTEVILVAEEQEATEPAMEAAEDDLSWNYDEETCTLTISGSGDMADCSGWAELKEQVELLVIKEGVTGICDAAFADMVNMYFVLLPNSLTSIGAGAFENCTGLNELFIPAGVTTVGSRAFAGCSSLYNFQFIGYDVTLGEDCFAGVTTQVYYPYDSAWSDCGNYGGSLHWIGYAKIIATGQYGTSRWTVEQSGALQIAGTGYVEEKSSAAEYPWYPYANKVIMLSYVTLENLPRNAFAGFEKLEVAYITQVSSIGSGAFRGCSNLKTIDFYGLSEIAADAFTGVTASVSFNVHDGWTEEMMQNYGGSLDWQVTYSGMYGDSIGWELSGSTLSIYAFSGETEVMESQISAEGYPWYEYRDRVQEIFVSNVNVGDYAFDGYSSLRQVQLDYPVQVGTCAFRNCTSLANILFDGPPPEIAEDAFTGVTAEAKYSTGFFWSETQLGDYGGRLTWRELNKLSRRSRS